MTGGDVRLESEHIFHGSPYLITIAFLNEFLNTTRRAKNNVPFVVFDPILPVVQDLSSMMLGHVERPVDE